MGGFQFANPFHFFLLIPLGIAAGWVYRRGIRRGMVFSPSRRIPTSGPSWRAWVGLIMPALFVAGMALLVVALARPRTQFARSTRSADAIAIEMVVDCSDTMRIPDMRSLTAAGVREQTRLEAVKSAFEAFVERRPDDLVGLVTFGGFANTRVPLTMDHGVLINVLRAVEVPKVDVSADGQAIGREDLMTAIGDGLATACARLEKAGTKSRIVVLLSDGESNFGVIRPEDATAVARKMGIKVYSIGVGVQMDAQTLGQIASTTGGQYFHVTDPGGLDKAMKDIDRLEKTRIQEDSYTLYNELFPWFLIPAMALIGISTVLNMATTRRIV